MNFKHSLKQAKRLQRFASARSETRAERPQKPVKQKQTITSIVQEIGDRSDKQTTITQDIDGISSSVGIVFWSI